MNLEPLRNTLLQRLQRNLPPSVPPFKRVRLVVGPWLAESGQVYFPEEGLIGLSSPSTQAMPAVVGPHGCWLHLDQDSQWPQLQAQVLLPGHALCVPWSVLAAAPEQAQACLWQAASASQQLMQQMAQWAYCTQHHATTQRLASWLLACLDHTGDAACRMDAAAVLQGLGVSAAEGQASLLALQAQAALVLEDNPAGAPGARSVRCLEPHKLAALACACHQQVSVSRGAG